MPHINEPGPSALKPIWKPNSTSTPSTAPASDIGRAPRAPSSAGWKIRRIRPRRCRRIETSTSAKPSPTAACPSCPHACIRPGQRDANPSRTGLWLSSAHSATSLQSISNRNAVTGPGPQSDPPEPRIAVPHARNQLGIGSMLKRTLPRRRKDSGRRDAHPPVGGASGFAHADRVPKLAQSPDDQGPPCGIQSSRLPDGHGNRAATPPALGAQRQARHAKKAKRKPT